MSVHSTKNGANFTGSIDMKSDLNNNIQMKSIYTFECFDSEGNLKWVEEINNIVVDDGLNDLLDKYFKGASYNALWYVGLKGTGAPAAGDTMASHSTWSEITAYSNTNRPTLTLGSVSAKSVDNSASKAVFNINGTADVYGGFIATNNTKGGTTGILYGVANFTTNRSVQNGDTLNVTVTLTAASA